MARILCVTQEHAALLYSTLELERRLGAAGHHVLHASFAEAADAITEHGVEFVELERGRHREFLEGDALKPRLQRLLNVRRRREGAVDALAVERFADLVQRVRPDLLLIDSEMHEHIIAASPTRVPIALLVVFVSIWQRPGLPPPHHLVRPGVGWRGSGLGIWLLWRNLRLRKRRLGWTQKVKHLGSDRLSALRSLAARVGFDFRGETDFEQWPIPFTYRRIPALSVRGLEFEFPHDPADHVRYLGPMVLKDRVDGSVSDEDRSRLEAILARRRNADRGTKILYAGFGSFFTADPAFLSRLFGAVGERDDWLLVISLGGRARPADLDGLPANVHAFSWVPQMEVLRNADAAVVHGGIGTVDECIVSGVPMLVYCGFETDMGGTTARVVHHGLGIAGDRHHDSSERIRRDLQRLLTDADFERNIQRMRERYSAYQEGRVAERVIQSLLEREPDDEQAV